MAYLHPGRQTDPDVGGPQGSLRHRLRKPWRFGAQSREAFNYPSEIVPAPSGDPYVSDGYRNARVHRFSGLREMKASWGELGKTGPGRFHLTHSLVMTGGEGVIVCDQENQRIQVFDRNGE